MLNSQHHVLLIEDEKAASDRLKKMIQSVRPRYTIIDTIDSVSQAVKWFSLFDPPSLIFMDIQLADDISFSIFDQITIHAPIIFTTAYDQYALKAFKVNSIDYLLKPIVLSELMQAIEKFEFNQNHFPDSKLLAKLGQHLIGNRYKERFLVKQGMKLIYTDTSDIAYFYIEHGLVLAKTFAGVQLALDYSVDQINDLVNPKLFYRINRKMIVQLKSIDEILTYSNSRLKLILLPTPSQGDIIVSRERVQDFKRWLDQ